MTLKVILSVIILSAFSANEGLASDPPHSSVATPTFKTKVRECVIAFGLKTGKSRWAYSQRFGKYELEPGDLLTEKLFRWDDEIAAMNPNGRFISRARIPEFKGVFTVENPLVKELNKKLDKNVVTSTINHYKRIFIETLNQEATSLRAKFRRSKDGVQRTIRGVPAEIAPEDISAIYNDFKSFRIMFSRNDKELRRFLKKVSQAAALRYAREVKKQSWFKDAVKKEKLTGLALDPRRWNLTGFGSSVEEADIVARFGRMFTTGSIFEKIARSDVKRIKHNPNLYRVRHQRVFKDRKPVGFGEVFFDYETLQNRILWHVKNNQVTRQLLDDSLPKTTPSGLKIFESYEQAQGRRMLSLEAIQVIRSVEVSPKFAERQTGRKAYLTALGKALEKHFGENAFVSTNEYNYFSNLELIKNYYDEINMFNPGLLVEKRVQIGLQDAVGTVMGVDFTGAGALNIYETQKALVRNEVKLERIKHPKDESEFMAAFLADTRRGETEVTKTIERLREAFEKEVGDSRLPVSGIKFTGDDGFAFPQRKLTLKEMAGYMNEVAGSRDGHMFRSTFVDTAFSNSTTTLSEAQKHRYLVFGENIEKKLRLTLKGDTFTANELKNVFFGVHVVPKVSGGGKINLIVSRTRSNINKDYVKSTGIRIQRTLKEVLDSVDWGAPEFRGFEVENLVIP